MKLSLTVLSAGKSAGKSIPITLAQFLIGRDPQCNLRPASAMISKRHCALLVKGGKVFVRDFDSTNGTFINNDQVKGEREIKHDDLLRVGPLEFRVVMEAATPVSKPTPIPTKASAAQDEEDMAAMLLSLQDDSSAPSASAAALEVGTSDEVPAGSTVMDLIAPPETKTEAQPDEAGKPDAKKPEPAKPATGNTSVAAKAILEKYTRRSRS